MSLEKECRWEGNSKQRSPREESHGWDREQTRSWESSQTKLQQRESHFIDSQELYSESRTSCPRLREANGESSHWEPELHVHLRDHALPEASRALCHIPQLASNFSCSCGGQFHRCSAPPLAHVPYSLLVPEPCPSPQGCSWPAQKHTLEV